MNVERHFALPETVDGVAMTALADCVYGFEAHLSVLERELACSSILAVFRRYPNLETLSFLVRDAADDETAPYFSGKGQVLDVTPMLLGENDDNDYWEETRQISLELGKTLTPRTVEFMDGLNLRRIQVLSHDGKPRFPDLRSMRVWIELDLK